MTDPELADKYMEAAIRTLDVQIGTECRGGGIQDHDWDALGDAAIAEDDLHDTIVGTFLSRHGDPELIKLRREKEQTLKKVQEFNRSGDGDG